MSSTDISITEQNLVYNIPTRSVTTKCMHVHTQPENILSSEKLYRLTIITVINVHGSENSEGLERKGGTGNGEKQHRCTNKAQSSHADARVSPRSTFTNCHVLIGYLPVWLKLTLTVPN